MIIKLKHDKLKFASISLDKPVLEVNRIVFNTANTKNWANRLFGAYLTIKFVGLGIDNKPRKTSQETLSFGAFLTPYHKQPVLDINQRYLFADMPNSTPDKGCKSWRTTFELNNLVLGQNESLDISITDRRHIQNRIKDWKKRVDDLYKETKSWLQNNPQYSLRIGNPMLMYEELMQSFNIPATEVNTADIIKEDRIVISFKPKGLWIIGANGRIDIISWRGNYILVDQAEQFKKPSWHVYTTTDKQKSKPFNKVQLLNLIDLVQ